VFNVNVNINCVKMCLDYVKQRELRVKSLSYLKKLITTHYIHR